MKKALIFGMLLGILISGCSKDDEEPLVADFSITVTGESPNAKLEITNSSTAATSYVWTFDKGASIASSDKKEPSGITVDKAGKLTIILEVSNGSEKKELSKTVEIKGYTAIETYTDLEFALFADDEDYGRFFSFETGKMYKDSEINESNGSKIHLAFGSMGRTMYYFESATEDKYNVPGATVTKVSNWESEPEITIEEFDTMVDDRLLSVLKIEETNESFSNGSIPGIVLFETATGRKGVIKTKSLKTNSLLVDIKIQKY